MKVEILNVNYLIDDKLTTIPTKKFYKESEDEDIELEHIHYEVEINHHHYESRPTDVTEFAVINLQRQLPENIRIASCQTCIHGNFCPFGSNDDDVYCLKDKIPKCKYDVVDVFSDEVGKTLELRSRKLLDFCSDYKPITGRDYYTYNDWYFFIIKENKNDDE